MQDYPFVITTESNSELPYTWEDETGVRVLRMPYTIDDTEYYYDLGRETDFSAFYGRMRAGAAVSTALRNQVEIEEYFEPFLQAGKDILHIAFSSALSGTFNNEVSAAAELLQKYPERKIILVDTLAISVPLAQLVEHATQMQQEGADMETIRDWVEAHKQQSCALFTVDSLEYLRRGGRLSGAAAFFGTVLEVKPVLYISPDGKLVPVEKQRGKRRAIKYMIDQCAAHILDADKQVITICHADCEQEALAIAEHIKEHIRPRGVRLNPVGPTIGSHAGPGTIGIVFFGKDRADLKK
ncbi:DegV family protein [Christensenellaceae bacterium OttesenSCG-928-L17]|nr:DegV family protein [Christensenellaceae bacterium OttesenSCG-928-L17]